MDPFSILPPTPAGWLRRSALASVFPAYVQYLVDRRYAVITRRSYCGAVAHFARWFGRPERGADVLTPADVRRFLDVHLPHCTCPPSARRSRHECRAALRHLVCSMRADGVLTEVHVSDSVEDELQRFDAEMNHERGLAANTRAQRLRIVRRLLATTPSSDSGPIALVTATRLRRFLAEEHGRWSPNSARVLTSTLRGYLRFRAAGGDQVGHLLPVIVSPAHWRLAALPDTLSPTEIGRLLAAFPPDLPSTARAYAMVRCLVDLGLRTHEVARLQLGDIDWDAGTIRIGPAKAAACRYSSAAAPRHRMRHRLPICARERPVTASRCVFVRLARASRHADQPGMLFAMWCGQPLPAMWVTLHARVHLLRHNPWPVGCSRREARIKEIADLLRHRALDTSLIYIPKSMALAWWPWPSHGPGARHDRVHHGTGRRWPAIWRSDRRLGFTLRIAGPQLLQFAHAVRATPVTTPGHLTLELQLDWARTHGQSQAPISCARRLEIVPPALPGTTSRNSRPQTAVPWRDVAFAPRPSPTRPPHLHGAGDHRSPRRKQGRLTPAAGLRPLTYQTLFGLIAAADGVYSDCPRPCRSRTSTSIWCRVR